MARRERGAEHREEPGQVKPEAIRGAVATAEQEAVAKRVEVQEEQVKAARELPPGTYEVEPGVRVERRGGPAGARGGGGGGGGGARQDCGIERVGWGCRGRGDAGGVCAGVSADGRAADDGAEPEGFGRQSAGRARAGDADSGAGGSLAGASGAVGWGADGAAVMAEEPAPVESPDVGLGEMAPDGVGQRAYSQA